jgi:hypothetical protein
MKLLKSVFFNSIIFFNDFWYHNILFFVNCLRKFKSPYILNNRNPETFNEKIIWYKRNFHSELGYCVTNKFLVREYVLRTIGEKYLIFLFDYVRNPIDLKESYGIEPFILKYTLGSGNNIIINNSAKYDRNFACKYFNKAFNSNLFLLSREWQTKSNEKGILVEKLLGDNILDYKIFCFHGEPKLIQVDIDRFKKHSRCFFDLNWILQDIEFVYPKSKDLIRAPKSLDEMIRIAKQLSAPFPFCRIDLYDKDGEIYFGEITLHPEGGVGPFKSKSMDFKLGKLLNFDK